MIWRLKAPDNKTQKDVIDEYLGRLLEKRAQGIITGLFIL